MLVNHYHSTILLRAGLCRVLQMSDGGGGCRDQGGFLSDLGGFSILVLRVYYDVYYTCSRLIHYMYYERIRVYYRYRNVIHCISMYYGVLDLEILIPYNTPLCRRDTCITRRCPNLL